jgi:hypothetical protein
MGLLLPRRHQGLLLPGHQHLPGPEPGVLCFCGHVPGGADCSTDPGLGPGHLEGRLAGLHGGLLSSYPVSSLGPELGLEAGLVVGPGAEQVVDCLPLFGPGLLAGCALPWGASTRRYLSFGLHVTRKFLLRRRFPGCQGVRPPLMVLLIHSAGGGGGWRRGPSMGGPYPGRGGQYPCLAQGDPYPGWGIGSG